jgi:hypothetical protein
LHLAIVPILLGTGERLFDHLDRGPLGYESAEFVSSPSVARPFRPEALMRIRPLAYYPAAFAAK